MPYDPSTGKITGAVGVADIAKALGAGRNEELRDHANILTWAKYKPFRNPAKGFADDNATRAARRQANMGYSVGTAYSSIANLMNAALNLDDDQCAWTYLKPRGTANNEPFRLLDFLGYDSHAIDEYAKPFLFTIEPSEVYRGGHAYIVEPMRIKWNEMIELSDMLGTPNLSGYYFGVAWRRSDSEGGWENPFAMTFDLADDPEIPSTTYANEDGSFQVVFFLSNHELTSQTFAPETGTYYLLPYPKGSFTYENSAHLVFEAEEDEMQTTSNLRFTLRVKGPETSQLVNARAVYRLNGRDPDDPAQSGEGEASLGNITPSTAGTEKYVIITSVNGQTYYMNGNVWLVYGLGGITYKQRLIIMRHATQ